MAYEDDLNALRVYQDPLLSPQEKLRRLTGIGAPPTAAPVAQQPDLRVAGPGGGEPPPDDPNFGAAAIARARAEQRAANAPPPQSDEAKIAAALGTGGASPETITAPDGTKGEPVHPDDPRLKPPEPGAEPPPEDGGAAAGGAGVTAEELRHRANILSQPRAGAGRVPTESITETLNVDQGTLSPEQAADIAAAKEARDRARMAADTRAAGEAMQVEDVNITALEDAAAERQRLAQIRAASTKERQRYRDEQNRTSQEIANMDPVEPSLWAGKNFGEKLLTLISLAGIGLGYGGLRAPQMIAPAVKEMANREADRQQRWLVAKQGKVDALGAILERHQLTYEDTELASRQTVIDILGIAELQTRKLKRPGMAQEAIAKLTEQENALRAARLEEQAKLEQALGPKIQTSIARQFVRPLQQQPAAPIRGLPAPAQQQAPAAAPAPELTGEELDAKELSDREAVRVFADPKLPREEKLRRLKGPTSQASTEAQPEERAGDGDWFARARDSWRAGDLQGALEAMPPEARRKYWELVEERKDLGEGTTVADRRIAAFEDMFREGAAKTIPQSARNRVVTLADGTQLYAPTKERAEQVEAALIQLDDTVSGLSKMVRLSRKYRDSGVIPPAVKSEIEGLGNSLMFSLSLAQKQGVIREAELPMYEKMVGSAMANYFKDPRYDIEAGLREVLRVFRQTKQKTIGTLSDSPTQEGSARRRIREVQ